MGTKSTIKRKWHGYYDLHLCQWNLSEIINLKQNYANCVSQAKKKKKMGLDVLLRDEDGGV